MGLTERWRDAQPIARVLVHTSLTGLAEALGRWTADHDRVLDGPAEERYLFPPRPGVPTRAYRTEIAWPIRSEPGRSSPPTDHEAK
ncbi:hypothetical protein E1258_24920 [Micromonospora sp. KC207]|uniref:hypothetical protein n=1 Tax=Micromonospora sp. KC207 TaxID=2530377 RepID=UPI00104A10A1|nr:hypothetical protein [Micromonospora sp. KC207]TDC52820.1 hypothetical protein E1258_24920 [Micromonospora sp. KC207]